MYHFDNSDFTNALKKHNFFVADKSCSNYTMTSLSLPSFLTSSYIDKDQRFSPYNRMNSSSIIKFLKQQGYTFINLSQGCGFTNHSHLADKEPYPKKQFGVFSHTFAKKTFVGPFVETYLLKYAAADRTEMIREQLRLLKKLSTDEKEPFFVFCHILCPHPPYVFQSDGGTRSSAVVPSTNFEENKKAYVSQIKGLNMHVLHAINTILTQEKNEPIIIINGDHGSSDSDIFAFHQKLGRPSTLLLKERMSILNAYHFPHGGKKQLYASITPVNTYRVLCNHYFDTKLEILSDTCYWSVINAQFAWRKYTPEYINELPFSDDVAVSMTKKES